MIRADRGLGGKIKPFLANCLWLLLCFNKHLAFQRAVNNVEKTQRRVLMEILRKNKYTEYGRMYRFKNITDIDQYRANVPLTTYESYQPYINYIANGKMNVLTCERVTMLAPTSGSTAASKYIPYTASLKEEFRKGIAPWIFDLFTHQRKILLGRAYWSLTPVNTQQTRTTGGIPVGFEEDTEYFGLIERYFLGMLLTVPKEVAFIQDIDAFRYVTLLFLLREKYLSFISVWNPSFLTLLLKPLDRWAISLVSDIKSGTLLPPVSIQSEIKSKLLPMMTKDEKRAGELEWIFNKFSGDKKTVYEKIWPYLAVISCWTDANAAPQAEQLKEFFPNVEIQGKGLLATEGIVSIPQTGLNGTALVVNSHFFEFAEIEMNSSEPGQDTKLAHQLEKDKFYTIIITTGGGLYRYKLHDIIQVVGFTGQCPLIRFIGKDENFCDICGEKLSEKHIQRSLQELFLKYALQPEFYMVAPEKSGDGQCFYTLFIEPGCGEFGAGKYAKGQLDVLVFDAEQRLRENYHYEYCRKLGQLEGLRLFVITKGGLETYLRQCCFHGQRLGEIKPVALHKSFGWASAFEGEFLNEV